VKKFVLLHYGFERPTPEIMAAWGKWFDSMRRWIRKNFAKNPTETPGLTCHLHLRSNERAFERANVHSRFGKNKSGILPLNPVNCLFVF